MYVGMRCISNGYIGTILYSHTVSVVLALYIIFIIYAADYGLVTVTEVTFQLRDHKAIYIAQMCIIMFVEFIKRTPHLTLNLRLNMKMMLYALISVYLSCSGYETGLRLRMILERRILFQHFIDSSYSLGVGSERIALFYEW